MSLITPTKTITVKLCKNYDLFSKVFVQIAPLHSFTESFSLFKPKNPPLKFSTNLPKKQNFQFQCSSANSYPSHSPFNPPTLIKALILFTFSLSLLFLRLISNLLLPDFQQRWHALLAFSSQAEAKLISQNYPQHLLQVVVAYEDRRFFCHFGVDPVGIARAVLSFSTRGGGSTITQQLVRNTFLKNERTFLRKVVEMVLAVAIERRISKLRILSSYLFKIYWGHGVNGIELASSLYFGKHPSLLSLGECAMLAGIIPSPELRSPFRDSSRGKTFQARVLRRMVEVGCLDIGTALVVVKQSINLNYPGLDHGDVFPLPVSDFVEGSRICIKWKAGGYPTASEIWDWESEDKMWEVKEDMQKWAIKFMKEKRPLVEARNIGNLPQSDQQHGQQVHLAGC